MSNLGFIYEQQMYNSYKQVGRVPSGFQPAGSNQSAPDFMFLSFKNIAANIELKVEGERSDTTLDYGQVGLTQLDNGQWIFSPRSPNKNLISAFMKYNLLDKINQSKWGKVKSAYLMSTRKSKLDKNIAYELDRQTFYGCQNWIAGGFKLNSSVVRDYYSAKGVNYINIKNRGFYLIGNDVLGLNPPLFNPLDVSAIIRSKNSLSGKSIRFTIALRVNGYPSSRGLDMTNRDDFLLALRNIEFPDPSDPETLSQKKLAIGYQSRPK